MRVTYERREGKQIENLNEQDELKILFRDDDFPDDFIFSRAIAQLLAAGKCTPPLPLEWFI